MEAYARDVVDGRIIACKWVKLAGRRHLRWLREQKKRGLRWDWGAAEIVIDFLEMLTHSKGEWAGQLLLLEGWEKFIVGNLFGWYRADHPRWREKVPGRPVEDSSGTRLFRSAYLEMGRKNGKTTLLAGIGIYMMVGDDEPGAEVYSAATKRDQAREMWDEARRMVEKSSFLAGKIKIMSSSYNMHVPGTASKFEPLSRDAKTADGKHPYANLIDEFHAHKTREMYDVMETGMGARRQPMQIEITTAGSNTAGIAYEERDRLKKILAGVMEDDTFFGVIYAADEKDPWNDVETWAKANPNLGVSVKMAYLKSRAKKASQSPAALNAFKTKHLDIWVGAMDGWMNMEWWHRCADPKMRLEDFAGMTAMIGLDLAAHLDLAALRILFLNGGHYYGFGKYYLPETMVLEDAGGANAHYVAWANQDFLTLTPGNIIDQNIIKGDVQELCRKFQVESIAVDPYQAVKLMGEMADEGLPALELGATVKHFSEPMKEIEAAVKDRSYHHDGDPVMTWCVSNTVATLDKKDNIFPNKEFPKNKIDALVAEIMAMNQWLSNLPPPPSVYDQGQGVEAW